MLRFLVRHRPAMEVPAGVVLGILAASAALTVDGIVELPGNIPAGDARGLLTVTFGALVTAGAFSFWMLPLAAQLASASVPPPVLAGRLRGSFQRRVIAVTVGALAYTAVTVLALPPAPDAAAPLATTVVGALLGVAGIAALLVAIQHGVRATQPSILVSDAATAVIDLIEQTETRVDDAPRRLDAVRSRGEVEAPVLAAATGWLEEVDEHGLLRDVPERTTVSLEAGLGTFAIQGWTRLATVRAARLEEPRATVERLAGHFTLARSRGSQLDLLGSITRFTDIAVHAGSGASGAPSVVYETLWHLGAILHALAGRELGAVEREHDGGRRLEWRREPDAPRLAAIAVDRIRQVVAAEPAMALELVRVVMDARRAAARLGHEELVAALDEQADLAVAQCRHADPLPEDLDRVLAARREADGGRRGAPREDEFPTDQERRAS